MQPGDEMEAARLSPTIKRDMMREHPSAFSSSSASAPTPAPASAPVSASASASASPATFSRRNLKHTQSDASPQRRNYHRKLLTPFLVVAALLVEVQRTSCAELRAEPSVQRRYLAMDAAALSQPEARGQLQIAENARQRLVSLALADLLQKRNQQQQQRSLWTQDFSQLDSRHQHQHQSAPVPAQQAAAGEQHRFVSYRPLVAASTMPTINRQIQPPNPFYELSLAPTSTIQIEQPQDSTSANNNNNQQVNSDEQEPQFTSAMSQPSPVILDPIQQQQQTPPNNLGTTSGSIEQSQRFEGQQQQQPSAEAMQLADNKNDNSKATGGGESGRSSQSQSEQQPSRDTIEPRQRRRLFNRILKKAEWNHLFVELSKVFLKYFLDLALKDIIGKQSASSGSGGAGSETSSRKKLDAQSELVDLVKEVFKNAISNI